MVTSKGSIQRDSVENTDSMVLLQDKEQGGRVRTQIESFAERIRDLQNQDLWNHKKGLTKLRNATYKNYFKYDNFTICKIIFVAIAYFFKACFGSVEDLNNLVNYRKNMIALSKIDFEGATILDMLMRGHLLGDKNFIRKALKHLPICRLYADTGNPVKDTRLNSHAWTSDIENPRLERFNEMSIKNDTQQESLLLKNPQKQTDIAGKITTYLGKNRLELAKYLVSQSGFNFKIFDDLKAFLADKTINDKEPCTFEGKYLRQEVTFHSENTATNEYDLTYNLSRKGLPTYQIKLHFSYLATLEHRTPSEESTQKRNPHYVLCTQGSWEIVSIDKILH